MYYLIVIDFSSLSSSCHGLYNNISYDWAQVFVWMAAIHIGLGYTFTLAKCGYLTS